MAEPLSGSATAVSGPPARSPEGHWYVPLAAVAAVVVVLAVAVSLGVAAMRPPAPQSFAPGSPSAAFAAYVAAVRQGDFATAEALISDRVKAENEAWQKEALRAALAERVPIGYSVRIADEREV
jgi:hypothetical protein